MDFSKGSYRLVFDNMQTDSIKLRFFFFSSLLTSSTHQTQLHNLHFLQKCSFKQDLSSTSSALSAFMLSLQCCCGNMLIWVKKKKKMLHRCTCGQHTAMWRFAYRGKAKKGDVCESSPFLFCLRS